ncbi:MAG: hypothetical protein NT138_16610 [Planctomycetales bacterium]|nr:hypothetical protein [Planctomycetales bacterium]
MRSYSYPRTPPITPEEVAFDSISRHPGGHNRSEKLASASLLRFDTLARPQAI